LNIDMFKLIMKALFILIDRGPYKRDVWTLERSYNTFISEQK